MDFNFPWKDKVNWDQVAKDYEKHGLGVIWKQFDERIVTDPVHTIYASQDVDIQPRWTSIPDKIIISTTVTGAFYNKIANPYHPVSMDEIYQSAREVCKVGAPILHLHVRNEEGRNVLNAKLLKDTFKRIKDEFPDVSIDCCLVPMQETWDQFMEMMESGLIESSPVNAVAAYCGDTLFVKHPYTMMLKAATMRKYGVRTRIAIYTDGDIDNADRYLIKTGLIPTSKDGLPTYWGVLPALPGGSPMNSPEAMVEGFYHLRNRILEIDPGAVIQVCATGRASIYLATLSVIMGHHLRVGMEDTPWKWPHKDEYIKSNAQHFLEYKQLCEILGREVYTAKEYRKFMNIQRKGE